MMFKNRYVYRAKLSELQFRQMLKYFVEDLSATQIAEKLSINRNTVNKYVNQMRTRIAEFCEQHKGVEISSTATEVLEQKDHEISQLIKQKLSLSVDYLKRRGKVYSQLISESEFINNLHDFKNKISFTQSTGKVHAVDIDNELDLVVIGYDNVELKNQELSYVDSLEHYWTFMKNRLTKFHGLAKHKFYLHVKECEFRFNLRNDDLYHALLTMFKEHPLEVA